MEITENTQKNIVFFGGIIAAIFVGKKLLEGIGLLKSSEDIKNEQEAGALNQGASGNPRVINTKNPALSLNPSYWLTLLDTYKKKKGGNLNINEINKFLNPDLSNGKSYHVNLSGLAERVMQSKSVWWLPDQEDKTMGVFRNLKSQAQVSKLASTFSDLYKTDLLAFIQSFMNDEQQAKLFTILKTKPLL